ncbi:hypothetical protein MLD38_026739 [Melastoma candidum]|uniref:Uncharacterized protein n=1 Tax=Melastoma candidum TaxID=119954 RepID=A0ACB9P5W1_9MYRT|nr:hypothetical protein MLD38_026739 [Melastoma candidum]
MTNNGKGKKKKKKTTTATSKKKKPPPAEQSTAIRYVAEWAFLDDQFQPPFGCCVHNGGDEDHGGFGPSRRGKREMGKERPVFELRCHSKFSDGVFSPTKVVERAHGNGVQVLALTDHDTLAGIPEAIEAARKFQMKIIPGVEISAVFMPSEDPSLEESVHVLAYYSCCGPTRYDELDKFLANIRDGRFVRAKNMVMKLNKLKLPLKWEHVTHIAGKDVAPGRLHIARALVEAGYVENTKQAFTRYLFDGGPAYSVGREPPAEEVVKLIRNTGGVPVLAHPWALRDPIVVIRALKDAGLHGLEVYRSNGKLAAFSDIADAIGLLKLGGSDFHGRRGPNESDVGSVNLPVTTLHDFLQLSRPIWCDSIRDLVQMYADDPCDENLARMTRFTRVRASQLGCLPLTPGEMVIRHGLLSWLTPTERQGSDFQAIMSRFSDISVGH